MTEKHNLMDFLDTVFVVNGEMIKDNGEDSYACIVNKKYGLVGVFDGCGGIGSRKYDVYGNRTGAYLASHTAAKVVFKWFEKFSEEERGLNRENISEICSEIKENFDCELKELENGASKTTIKGSLAKSFPTTASLIMFTPRDQGMYASFVWVGDSRGFVLNSKGLTQITQDDIDSDADALSNISNDGRLSNVISASGDYVLNSKGVICSNKGILITATDGCFGYFSTPMEFEYMILSTLLNSKSIEDWKKRMGKYIREYAGDDYTLGIAIFGYSDFKNLKRHMAARNEKLYKEYISKLDNISEENKLKLWEEYKKTYYRGV